jgi:hypothetical protein
MRESTSVSFPGGASEAVSLARHGVSPLLDGKLTPIEITWPNMTYAHRDTAGIAGMTQIGAFEMERLKIKLQPSVARAFGSLSILLRVKLPMSVSSDVSFYDMTREFAKLGFMDPATSKDAYDVINPFMIGSKIAASALPKVHPDVIKATSLALTSYISMYLTSQGGFATAMDLLDDGLRTYSLDEDSVQISLPHHYDTDTATLVADAIVAVLQQAATVVCVNPMMRAALDAAADDEFKDVASVMRSNLRMALSQRGNG